jgi:hypothetical protein
MAEFDSALIIKELAGDEREIRLVGPALPFRPASWEGENGIVTTWYPGNGVEASQQVLGPRELPSDFEGMWRRTMLGRAPAVLVDGGVETKLVHPMDLCNVFDDIRIRGNRLRVTWAAVDGTGADRGKIVREGRLQKFTMSPDRVDDIAWKMHFEWYGRGGALQKVAVSREGDAIAALSAAKRAANALAGMQAVADLIKSVPKSVNALTLGQLEQLAKLPLDLFNQVVREAQKIVSTIDRIGNLALKIRSLPFDIANSALAAAHNAISVANRFQDKISRLSPEQMATKRGAADVVRAAATFARGTDAARDMALQAYALKQKTQQIVGKADGAKAMLGIHVVRQGETVSSIAAKWYGNADLTDPICRSNKLPLSAVSPGRPTLVIPSLASQKS